MVRERLGRVAAAVVAAAERRLDAAPATTREALSAVIAVLTADYGLEPGRRRDPADDSTTADRDPLARIGWAFDLDATSVDLVAVATAPDLDANLARAFQLLCGPETGGRASVALALELCGIPGLHGPQWLDSTAPLRQHGLVRVIGDQAWSCRAVAAADRVRSYVAEVTAPSPTLSRASVVAAPEPGTAADELAAAVADGATMVWLRSAAGLEAAGVAVAGFAQTGSSSLVIDLRRTHDPGALLAEAALEASLFQAALVVAGVEHAADLDETWLDIAGRSPMPVALIVGAVAAADRHGAPVVDVPPSQSGRATPIATFRDLELPAAPLAELRRLVRWVRTREEVLARGPVHGLGGKGTGLAALFAGSPGTGKTLAAHVVAAEIGRELRQIDLASVVDKYVGETTKHLDRIFDAAESANVVLFFDEADALFGQRSAVRDAHDRYANQEVSYLLQRMEAYDGVTLLATNLLGNLDPAFSRRLHFIVHFPEPDRDTRRRLWERHLASAGGLDPADVDAMGVLVDRVEMTGGEIRNIVLAATYEAAADGRRVGVDDLRAAALREYHKLGRRPPALGVSQQG